MTISRRTSDYVNDKLDLHSRELMSPRYEWCPLRIDIACSVRIKLAGLVKRNSCQLTGRQTDYALKLDHVR